MYEFVCSMQKSNLLLFVLVYLSFFLDNVLLTVVVPIIPDYLFSNELNHTQRLGPASLSPLQLKYERLDAENGPLGALLASKAFVQLALTPLMGYLTETVGCSLPLLLGSCNMLLAAILFAFGNSYGVLVLARALHGSSSAAIAVSGMSLLAKQVPSGLRSKLMPLAFGGIALGVLIGYPLGGGAYQLLGKSAPFILIAVFIAINIILQIMYLEEVPDTEPHSPSHVSLLHHLQNKRLLIATTTICVCTSTMAIIEPCVPLWLLAHLSPPPTRWQLGAIFIPDSLGYFIGSHLAGLLPIRRWRVAFCALVLAGLSCFALPLAGSLRELAWPHFGLGLSVGAVDAALVPFLADLVDEGGGGRYGSVYALQQLFVSLAYALGPLLGGEGVRFVGFPWMMRFIGALNLCFAPLLLELESAKTGYGMVD